VRLSALKKYVEDLVAASSSGGGGGGGGAVPTVVMYGQLRALVPAGYSYVIALDEDIPGETDPTFGNAKETPIVDGVPDYPRMVETQGPGVFGGADGFITDQMLTSFPDELVEVRIPVHFSHTDGESGSATLKLREPAFGAFHNVDQIAFGVNP
jgi:hypothetical protein